jgi:hypothetical protein
MNITTKTLQELRAYPHIKQGSLARSVGLNEATIRTKVKEGRELSDKESELLSKGFGPFYSESDVKPLIEALRGIFEAERIARDGEFTSFDADALDTAMAFANRALEAWEGGEG